MPREPVGARSFLSIGEILDLPSDRGLRFLETDAVIPTLDLGRILRSDQATLRLFEQSHVVAAGVNQSDTLDLRSEPDNASDGWDQITVRDIIFGVGGSYEPIPDDHEILVLEAGLSGPTAGPTADWKAMLYRLGSSSLTQGLLWFVDDTGGQFLDGVFVPQFVARMPWYFPPLGESVHQKNLTFRREAQAGGYTWKLQLLTIDAPQGVLSLP